tara:strand:- start:1183 stop:1770 length:588 start_codon:yes stop_codon:yes gene_type:complete
MTEHYYSRNQTSPLNLREINVVISGKAYTFFTGSGVFSKKKLDFGTKVLTSNMQVKEGDEVLDLGCGIGIVGRVAATKTSKKVVLSDVNSRAVKLARMNTKNLKQCNVVRGDLYESVEGEKFDVILVNPPQTAGKKVCHAMIEGAKEHLKKGGSLQLVARHNKGGESLSKHMEKVFGNMHTIVKQGGYRVYVSIA